MKSTALLLPLTCCSLPALAREEVPWPPYTNIIVLQPVEQAIHTCRFDLRRYGIYCQIDGEEIGDGGERGVTMPVDSQMSLDDIRKGKRVYGLMRLEIQHTPSGGTYLTGRGYQEVTNRNKRGGKPTNKYDVTFWDLLRRNLPVVPSNSLDGQGFAQSSEYAAQQQQAIAAEAARAAEQKAREAAAQEAYAKSPQNAIDLAATDVIDCRNRLVDARATLADDDNKAAVYGYHDLARRHDAMTPRPTSCVARVRCRSTGSDTRSWVGRRSQLRICDGYWKGLRGLERGRNMRAGIIKRPKFDHKLSLRVEKINLSPFS